MAKLAVASVQQQVNKLVLAQLFLIVFVSCVFLAASSLRAALACLAGGSVHLIPCYFYAKRLFSDVSPRAVGKIMITFYLGEVLKLVVSVGLFIGLYLAYHMPLLPYFVGYMVATLSFCVAPLLLVSNRKK